VRLAAEADVPAFGGRAAEAVLLDTGPVEGQPVDFARHQTGDGLVDGALQEGRVGGQEVAASGAGGGEAVGRAVGRAPQADGTEFRNRAAGVGGERLEQEIVAAGRPVRDLLAGEA
jgi:hypothetical protein